LQSLSPPPFSHWLASSLFLPDHHSPTKIPPGLTSSCNFRWFFTRGLFITLTMMAVRTSETSVYFNETTRHYIPKSCHFYVSVP
jgi:hypothetical protein